MHREPKSNTRQWVSCWAWQSRFSVPVEMSLNDTWTRQLMRCILYCLHKCYPKSHTGHCEAYKCVSERRGCRALLKMSRAQQKNAQRKNAGWKVFFPYPRRGIRGDALPRRQTSQTNTPSPLEVSGATQRTCLYYTCIFSVNCSLKSTARLNEKEKLTYGLSVLLHSSMINAKAEMDDKVCFLLEAISCESKGPTAKPPFMTTCLLVS